MFFRASFQEKTMIRFILGKLLYLVPTFLGITIVAFAFVRVLPGDPVLLMAGERGISPERHAQLAEQLGFSQPIWQQYLHFLGRLLQGDLGNSLVTKKPVLTEFLSLFPATVELGLVAIIIATLIGVPRTPAGYDLDHLERLLAHHRPTAFFTQPHLHSPTCSRTPLPQLHRLLKLAGQHGFRLVENNLYADMIADPLPCLASLDHLQQVVYVGSYSKSISPNVRVGYILANPELTQKLVHLKMRSGLTTSQVMERVVYAAIIDGRWRKHLKRLRQRLAEAHQEVGRHLHRLGFELFTESDEGMYIWTRHPAIPDSALLLDDALEKGIMLGPGQLFMVDAGQTGWMRFNVAFSLDPLMWEMLEQVLAKHVRRGGV